MEDGRKAGRGREREGEGTDKWREGEMGEGMEGGAQAMPGNQLSEYMYIMIQLTRHIVLINLLYS